ncbi:MAG: patatin-like phospholipase family protein [Clostridia bacterium]|nr:patatin-like phospholipase family protein [Clostridia bacterium]
MKLGVALSGGGIRGIAHAGALKALQDNNIKIDVIGGTSAGAMISTLYAIGYTPYYIYMLFKRYAKEIIGYANVPIILSVKKFVASKKLKVIGEDIGILLEKEYARLAKNKGINNIKDINTIPIVIPAVDVLKSKEYIFTNKVPKDNEINKYITEIPIGKAVRASSSFPGVFSPCKFKHYQFIDGGVLNNVPVTEVKKQGAEKVIAINFKADDIDETSNMMDIGMRTIDIMGNKISEENLAQSDFVLTIQTDKTGLLDIEKLDSCYKYGYQAVIDNLDKIKKLL